MATIVQLLRRRGIEVPFQEGEDLAADKLRSVLEREQVEVEADADGSRRIMLSEAHDQLTLTPDRELVVVHGELAKDNFDSRTNAVYARTTAKAAKELTKLRMWRAVEAGLRRARAIGQPGQPATLEEWLQQNREDADRLQQQVDTLGLAAEKTHEWSALVFEPALLAGFKSREIPFTKAMAAYAAAELLRVRILADTTKRLLEKKRTGPEERQRYLGQKEKLSARAARLYEAARDLFSQALAKSLANTCAELTSGFARPAAAAPASAKASQAEMQPMLRSVLAQREYAEARRVVEPSDLTLPNTVQTINACQDPKWQGSLAMHFANHLIDVAKRLKTTDEVALLVARIDALKENVTEDAFINRRRIDQYRRLILEQRPDVLPVLGQPQERH